MKYVLASVIQNDLGEIDEESISPLLYVKSDGSLGKCANNVAEDELDYRENLADEATNDVMHELESFFKRNGIQVPYEDEEDENLHQIDDDDWDDLYGTVKGIVLGILGTARNDMDSEPGQLYIRPDGTRRIIRNCVGPKECERASDIGCRFCKFRDFEVYYSNDKCVMLTECPGKMFCGRCKTIGCQYCKLLRGDCDGPDKCKHNKTTDGCRQCAKVPDVCVTNITPKDYEKKLETYGIEPSPVVGAIPVMCPGRHLCSISPITGCKRCPHVPDKCNGCPELNLPKRCVDCTRVPERVEPKPMETLMPAYGHQMYSQCPGKRFCSAASRTGCKLCLYVPGSCINCVHYGNLGAKCTDCDKVPDVADNKPDSGK